jgi:quercetin dioxygenase-like cupin family protein
MSDAPVRPVVAAQMVLPAPDLAATLDFFVDRLGFRVESIFPADAPAVAVIAGHGLRLRLMRDAGAGVAPGRLLLLGAAAAPSLTAPNGTRIDFAPAVPPLAIPEAAPALIVSRAADAAAWGTGRAGMRYRDLIPGRYGGRFIASAIAIPEGGPVPDYVHFHRIRFQAIFCRSGWVRVVYEDQGPDFVMAPGDCVLQPPGIRHRVLEASPGLEVIEIACPAAHETVADPVLALPNARFDPARDFSGQRFLRHVARDAIWAPWRAPGFLCRSAGMAAATSGLAELRVVRPDGAVATPPARHDGELLFAFVLAGALTLEVDGAAPAPLGAGDSVVIPAGRDHRLAACSGDLEWLEVTLPAALA